MPSVPPIIKSPSTLSSQSKILLAVLLVLLLVGGGLAYKLWGDKLPFGKNDSDISEVPVPKAPSSFESCQIKKEGNPLIWDVKEITPEARQIDFRGKIKSVTSEGDKTIVALISVDGSQTHEFTIDSNEIVYGKQNYSLKDLKFPDELLIAANCTIDKEGSFRISRIYKMGE